MGEFCGRGRELRAFMSNLIEKTKQTGKEHGFQICAKGDEISPGIECVGTDCAVKIGDCSGAVRVGTFHTHPHEGVPRPSYGDMRSARDKDVELSCIGGTSDVMCYDHRLLSWETIADFARLHNLTKERFNLPYDERRAALNEYIKKSEALPACERFKVDEIEPRDEDGEPEIQCPPGAIARCFCRGARSAGLS